MNKKILLAALFVTALVLRLAGVGLGLPSQTGGLTTLHADESVTFYSLERMNPGRLDFYPGESLNWGSFYVYSVGALVKTLDLAGVIELRSRDGLKKHLGEVDKMYVAARCISVFFGTLSVVMLFLVGSVFLSRRAAAAAAAFMAVALAPVMSSSLVKVDSTMLFWALLAVYYSLRLMREPSVRNYCLGGLFFGLALVTKYSALLMVLVPLGAHFIRAREPGNLLSDSRKLLLALLCGVAVFLLLNPFVLTRPEMYIFFGNVHKGSVSEASVSTYLAYFASVLPASMGFALVLFAIAGLMRWFRGSAEKKLLAAHCVIFMLWSGGTLDQHVIYMLPLIPFLCLAAGDLADSLAGHKALRLLAPVVFMHSLAYTACVRYNYVSSYTIKDADAWIKNELSSGSVVAIPKNDVWTPFSIRRKTASFKVLEAARSSETQYDAVVALAGIYRQADYLVLAEWEFRPPQDKPDQFPAEAAALKEILSGTEEVKRFSRRLPRWALPFDLAGMQLYVNFMNPEIRVYKVKRA